jgi:hypothetical protein
MVKRAQRCVCRIPTLWARRSRGALAWLAGTAGLWLLLLAGKDALIERFVCSQVFGAELPVVAGSEATLADLSAIPGVTPQYVAAVNQFLQAQRSDNPARDYTVCIAAFQQIAAATDNPELQIRSHYFLAFALLLQRDVAQAYQHAKTVLTLARGLYRNDTRVGWATRLADLADRGDLTLSDMRIAITAQSGAECSRLVGDLGQVVPGRERTRKP